MDRARKDEVDNIVNPLIGLGVKYKFGIPTYQFDDIEDSEIRGYVEILSERAGRWTKSLLELQGVYEETIICLHMSSSFPWNEEEITHSQYLHFCWVQFVNLCYLFREKTKKFCNDTNEMLATFGEKERFSDVAAFLCRVDAGLKRFIRARGEHVHEWNVGHDRVKDLRLFETMRRLNQWPGDWPAFETFYEVAKNDLRADILGALETMGECLLETLNDITPVAHEQLEKFGKAIEQARKLNKA